MQCYRLLSTTCKCTDNPDCGLLRVKRRDILPFIVCRFFTMKCSYTVIAKLYIAMYLFSENFLS